SYGGFGLSEENDSGDPTYIHTLAVETPFGWVINGNKKYISNAPLATVLLVAARTKSLDGSDGTGIFIIEADRKGLTVTEPMEKTGIRPLQVASVQLQQVEVAHDALLGNILEGVDQVTFTMNLMKLSVAMQAVGIAHGAFAKGLEHMSVVRKFGNRLIDNQSTQERMADMKTSIYSAEAFVRMVMTDTQNSIEVAMAKLLTANIALQVTESIIQLTGGYGFMKDSDIERYIRDAKVTSIYGGSSRSQRRMITEPWVNS
uniref:acyl-CoA dehydrogenase family protein n=1 Tax=Jeotgalibaca porci TaxID=1868793 RepID=UPI0035A058C9